MFDYTSMITYDTMMTKLAVDTIMLDKCWDQLVYYYYYENLGEKQSNMIDYIGDYIVHYMIRDWVPETKIQEKVLNYLRIDYIKRIATKLKVQVSPTSKL